MDNNFNQDDFENPINDGLGEFVDIETGEILDKEPEFVEFTINDLVDPDDFDDSPEGMDEVINLDTFSSGVDNFQGSANLAEHNSGYGMAEYHEIQVDNIITKQSKLANKFVTDVSKFIVKLGDVQLNNRHRSYIETVSQLKVDSLVDLMTMRTINFDMIKNIVHTINSTNGEDVMVIQNYNTLCNTQLKLTKELDDYIRRMPSDLKKLRNDVLSPEQLEKAEETDYAAEVVGKNTHTNTMSLLKEIEAEEAKAQMAKNNLE